MTIRSVILPYYLVLFKPPDLSYANTNVTILPYYLVLFKPEEEKYEEARGSYELPYYLVLFKQKDIDSLNGLIDDASILPSAF